MNIKSQNFLTPICWILGLVFLISAYGKISDPQAFGTAIENYRVFGDIIASWIALIFPVLELVLGLMLVLGIWKRESLLLTFFLYVVFDLMIIQAGVRGLDIDCGCFGNSLESSLGLQKFLENGILTAFSVLGWKIERRCNAS